MKEKVIQAVDAELLRNGGTLHVGNRVGVLAMAAVILAAAGMETPEELVPEAEEPPKNDGRGSAGSAEAAAAAKAAKQERAAAAKGIAEIRAEAEADKAELQDQIAELKGQLTELIAELKNPPGSAPVAEPSFASEEAEAAFTASGLTSAELAGAEPSSTKGFTKGDIAALVAAN